jgi:hypothetical protein
MYTNSEYISERCSIAKVLVLQTNFDGVVTILPDIWPDDRQVSNHCLFTIRILAKSAMKTPLWTTLTDPKLDYKSPSDRPQVSVSLSVSVSAILLNFRIGIGIADIFKDSIGIEYRPYFSKVSLTSLVSPSSHF